MSIKNKTIKNVEVSVLNRFEELKTRLQCETDTQAFTLIVNKTFENPVNIDGLQKENTDLKQVNTDLNEQAAKTAEYIIELKKQLEEAENRINELANAEPQTVEVNVPVPIQLEPTETIYNFPEELAIIARKARKLMRSENSFNGSDEEYPNYLITKSLNYFLKHKYEEAYDHKK